MAKFIDVRDPQSSDICYCSHTRSVHSGAPGARWKCYAGSERRFVKIPCACVEFAFSRRAPELEEKLYASRAEKAERAGRIVMKPIAPPCRHPLLRVKANTPMNATTCVLCGELVSMLAWIVAQPRGAFLAAADYLANQVAMQTLPPELQAPKDLEMLLWCSRCNHRRDFHVNDEWECGYGGCECGMFVEAKNRAPQGRKPAPPMLFSDQTRKFWKDED